MGDAGADVELGVMEVFVGASAAVGSLGGSEPLTTTWAGAGPAEPGACVWVWL